MKSRSESRREGAKPPTLRDIAARVGVSFGTVSAVLANAPRAKNYSEETKQKIRMVAEELGYAPNPLGRILSRTSPGTIGCVSFKQPDIYYGHILRGAEEEFRQNGHEPITVSMNYDRHQFRTCLQQLAAWRVEGYLLMMGGRPIDQEMAEAVDKLGLPYVAVDAYRVDGSSPCTGMNIQSGQLIAAHLADLGHRDLALLGLNPSNCHTTERLDGIMQVVRDRGLTLASDSIIENTEGYHGPQAGDIYATRLLDAGKAVSAIMCMNDIIALGAMHALHKRGVRIPEDISVTGFDDVCVDVTVTEENRLSAYLWPALTTVRVPHSDMGRRAAAALLECLENPVAFEHWQFDVTPELIVRDSTGPAK